MESLKLMVAANRHFRSAGSGAHSLRGAPDPADSLHQRVSGFGAGKPVLRQDRIRLLRVLPGLGSRQRISS